MSSNKKNKQNHLRRRLLPIENMDFHRSMYKKALEGSGNANYVHIHLPLEILQQENLADGVVREAWVPAQVYYANWGSAFVERIDGLPLSPRFKAGDTLSPNTGRYAYWFDYIGTVIISTESFIRNVSHIRTVKDVFAYGLDSLESEEKLYYNFECDLFADFRGFSVGEYRDEPCLIKSIRGPRAYNKVRNRQNNTLLKSPEKEYDRPYDTAPSLEHFIATGTPSKFSVCGKSSLAFGNTVWNTRRP